MAVNPVSPNSNANSPQTAVAAAEKQATMKQFAQIRNTQAYQLGGDIMTSMFGNKTPTTLKTPEIPQNPATQITVPATQAKTAQTLTPKIPAGNTLNNTQKVQVNITNVARNTGNVVNGPEGFANRANAVTVNGAKNNINIAGTAPAGVTEATFKATGGAGITNTSLAVTGDQNKITFTGQNLQNNAININGTGNAVELGTGVSNANLNIAGNNVQVKMGGNNLLSKNQSNWNVNVSTNNVAVTIENGEAKVSGLNGNNAFKVQIDQEKHTVTVTEMVNG